MKVNSCHIPPRSLTLRSRVVSFLLAALTLHFRHFVRTVHSRAEGEARGRGGQGTGVSKEKETGKGDRVNGMRNGSVRSFFPPSAVPSHAVSLRRRYGPSFVSHVPLSDRSCRRRMIIRREPHHKFQNIESLPVNHSYSDNSFINLY